MGVPPMSSMGILPMSTTGILPVGFPVHGRARMALRLTGRMPVLRLELVAGLIVVVYPPPAGKGNFFHPGVRGRATRQAVAPRVGDVGVRVAGRAVGILDAAGDGAPGVNPYGSSRFIIYMVSPDFPRFSYSMGALRS